MIEVRATDKGGYFTIQLDGHANFNPGNDVVCAAASTLIQTFAASAENGIGGASVSLIEFSSGKATVKIKGGGALYRSCVLGFMMLEKAHPENVKVITK